MPDSVELREKLTGFFMNMELQAGSAQQFCAIAPGLVQILGGLQSIIDNLVTDSQSRQIVDGVFSAATTALSIAEALNGCSHTMAPLEPRRV